MARMGEIARERGRVAGRNKAYNACPYSEGKLRTAWLAGWDETASACKKVAKTTDECLRNLKGNSA